MSEKSKMSALLLAFFLGGFGTHRFYVGKVGSGITILLLSLSIIGLPISLVWCWIDIIMILVDKFEDSERLRLLKW